MKRLNLIQEKKISAEVEAIVQNTISVSGNGACVYVPKEYLRRRAIIGIYPEDLNICDDCGKPMMTKNKEDSLRRSKDKKFDKEFCACWKKEKI